MTIRSSDSPSDGLAPKMQYEVEVTVFNKKTGEYKKGSSEIGARTAQLIHDSGGISFFDQARPGDLIEITEKGVYKKVDGEWKSALTQRETKTLRAVQEILPVISSRIETEPEAVSKDTQSMEFLEDKAGIGSQIVIEVRVKERVAPNVQPLVDAVYATHPDLAKELTAQAAYLNDSLETHRELLKDTAKNRSELLKLSEEIEGAEKTLKQLIESAKTADVAEEYIQQTNPAYREIKRGQAKIVSIKEGDPLHAFYTPVSGLMERVTGLKEAEIKGELVTSQNIKTRLYERSLAELLETLQIPDPQKTASRIAQTYKTVDSLSHALANEQIANLAEQLKMSPKAVQSLVQAKDQIDAIKLKWKNLAIEQEEMLGADRIEGKFTVRVDRALNDLTDTLVDQKVPFDQRVEYIMDFLTGMAALHEAGYVHGDLKLDNLLLFIDGLKISDWGKTRLIKEMETVLYTGNGRACPPEKKLSKAGEVYGAALLVIRILEEGEGILDTKTQMIDQALDGVDIDTSVKPAKERRGFDKFSVMSKALPASESSLRGRMRTFGPGFLTSFDPNAAEEVIGGYIDKVTKKLQKKGATTEQAQGLNILLKKMTASTPSKRGTMREAADACAAVLQQQG